MRARVQPRYRSGLPKTIEPNRAQLKLQFVDFDGLPLVLHSLNDQRTTPLQAYPWFQALQLLGVPTEMVP